MNSTFTYLEGGVKYWLQKCSGISKNLCMTTGCFLVSSRTAAWLSLDVAECEWRMRVGPNILQRLSVPIEQFFHWDTRFRCNIMKASVSLFTAGNSDTSRITVLKQRGAFMFI